VELGVRDINGVGIVFGQDIDHDQGSRSLSKGRNESAQEAG
jgi:hypothetical protein